MDWATANSWSELLGGELDGSTIGAGAKKDPHTIADRVGNEAGAPIDHGHIETAAVFAFEAAAGVGAAVERVICLIANATGRHAVVNCIGPNDVIVRRIINAADDLMAVEHHV